MYARSGLPRGVGKPHPPEAKGAVPRVCAAAWLGPSEALALGAGGERREVFPRCGSPLAEYRISNAASDGPIGVLAPAQTDGWGWGCCRVAGRALADAARLRGWYGGELEHGTVAREALVGRIWAGLPRCGGARRHASARECETCVPQGVAARWSLGAGLPRVTAGRPCAWGRTLRRSASGGRASWTRPVARGPRPVRSPQARGVVHGGGAAKAPCADRRLAGWGCPDGLRGPVATARCGHGANQSCVEML